MSEELEPEFIIDVKSRRTKTIGKLAEALAKAQGKIVGAIKDSANPFFKSKYADLASVWESCRKPLADNGLAVIQKARSTDTGIEVETILAHSSGEEIGETLSLPVSKADAQGIGSAITYARRYALAAMVGVAPEDDDGNAASAGMAGIHKIALPKLQAAASKGPDALKEVWESLTKEARAACAADLPKLKEQANAVGSA